MAIAGPARRGSSRARLGALAAGAAAACVCTIVLLGGVALEGLGGCAPGGAAPVPGAGSLQQPAPTPFALRDIPAPMLRQYVAAAAQYGIDWSVLAGIGWAECDNGRSHDPACFKHGATNSAGAGGPMQFLASTWAAYGNGGDRWNPHDAVFAAANYLKASGAPGDYRRAIFAYNHADWYVAEVLRRAARYSTGPARTPTTQQTQAAAAPDPGSASIPALSPVTLQPPNFGENFSFQDLVSPRVGSGWAARGWESSFNDHITASGIPADSSYPGVSFWHTPTVLGFWAVTFPDRRTLVLRQIDTGPNTSLHRLVDVDYAAVVRAGYSIGTFPTGGSGGPGGQATVVFLGGDAARWGALNGTVVNGAALQPPAACPQPAAAVSPGTYIDPIKGQNWTLERTDQGVDMATNSPYPIRAIGTARIMGYAADGWGQYGGYMYYRLLDGFLEGKCVYVAEGIHNVAAVGTVVPAGQPVAYAIPGWHSGTEWGWSAGLDSVSTPAPGQDHNNQPGGLAFARFLRRIGSRTRDDPGPGPLYAGASC